MATMLNTNRRRELMAERDKAIAARDWQRMNSLTAQIAALPMAGIKPLSRKDVARYIAKRER